METAGVWGRKKCRNDKQRTRWWNKEVETAVRKKIACKRWLQVKTREAKEEYLILKRAAGHEVSKANKYFELKNSWGADGAPQTQTTC